MKKITDKLVATLSMVFVLFATSVLVITAQIEREAEITSPSEGSFLAGTLNLAAYLQDEDNDGVQWAVREGTCDAGTNTVLGNVDGHSDSFTWTDSDENYKQYFTASADTTGWTDGEYCFIFNPTEDYGDEPIRLTRWFVVDNTAPLATIEAPEDGDVVGGTVDIYGSVVEDTQLSHYNIAIYPGGSDYMVFSNRLEQSTVYRTDGFNNELIYQWDTAGYSDGEYLIRLAARDKAGNRDLSGYPDLGGDDSQHVISVTVDNTAPEKVDGMTIWQDGKEIGCGAIVKDRTITVDWNGSADSNFSYYRYQADDGVDPIDFTTTVVPSERTGQIRDLDGTYNYRVQAVDSVGNTGEYSEWCSVTLDRQAPEITLDLPEDGSPYSSNIPLQATCNEDCSYINFWWKGEGQEYSNVSPDRRYHYVYDGTDGERVFEWDLNPEAGELWGDDGTYVMEDGIYYFYAAGKDLAGNWARTETHMIYLDKDNDGVVENDLCPGTVMDVPTLGLGTNRWAWDSDTHTWASQDPKGTQNGNTNRNNQNPGFTMADTQGCSCTQILEKMEETTGGEFGGHWKYGCSKSILEDWISGEYYVDPITVDTFALDVTTPDGTSSSAVLESGKDYTLKISGKGYACNQESCIIEFDADYSSSFGGDWVDGVAPPYDTYGVDLLDIKVDDTFVDWGTYNNGHTYQYSYAGTGSIVNLALYDLPGSYFNDTGSFTVEVIEDGRWVDLW